MKTTLPFIKFNVNISVFLLVAAFLRPITAAAQTAPPAAPIMVQSTFYDAQALYYALKGYNAYPVYLPGKNKTVPSAAAATAPAAAGCQSTPGNPTRTNNGPGGAGTGPGAHA